MATRNENRGGEDLPVRPANSRRSSYEDILAYLDSCLGRAVPTENTRTNEEIEMNANDNGQDEPSEAQPRSETATSGHIVIEMPEDEEIEEQPENPIFTFLKLCNFLCLVPYRLKENLEKQSFCAMVPYFIIHIIHLLYTLIELRRNAMFGAFITRQTNVSSYIFLTQFFIRLFLRISFIHCVTVRLPIVKGFIEYCKTTIYTYEVNSKKTHGMVLLLTAITGITTVLKVVILVPPNRFSEHGLSQSGWVTMFYFKYLVNSINSTDYWEYSYEMEEQEYTPLAAHENALGIVSCVLFFFTVCLETTARNLILIGAYLLKQCADLFHDLIPDAISESDNSLANDIKTWFTQLKKISKLFNSIIYILHPLFLADNLLDLVAFYNYTFVPGLGFHYKLTAAMQVIRTLGTFYLAERVVGRIMQFRDWLRDEGERMLNTQEATLFLEEISINPIGLGKDPLFVNKAFILSFIGISAAYFLSLVETRDH